MRTNNCVIADPVAGVSFPVTVTSSLGRSREPIWVTATSNVEPSITTTRQYEPAFQRSTMLRPRRRNAQAVRSSLNGGIGRKLRVSDFIAASLSRDGFLGLPLCAARQLENASLHHPMGLTS